MSMSRKYLIELYIKNLFLVLAGENIKASFICEKTTEVVNNRDSKITNFLIYIFFDKDIANFDYF